MNDATSMVRTQADAEADQLAARIAAEGEGPIAPRDLLAAADLVRAGRARVYKGLDGELIVGAFDCSEENCPGHVAAEHDPKVCGRCGVHVDSFLPDEQGP